MDSQRLRALLATSMLPLLALAVPSSAGSEETPDSTIVLIEPIQVRGVRPVTTAGGAAAIEASLDSLSLTSDPSMEQVLRELPATYIRTNSRGEVEVTVRGSESRQVAILLDGVPITFGWDGRTDVSVVPALAPRQVVFVRGLSSLTHGPNTLGGVVEFNTSAVDPMAQKLNTQIRAGVDQVGGFELAGSVTIPRRLDSGIFTARAGIGHRDSPGQPLARGVREPVPTDDDLRLNTDIRQTSGFLTLRMDTERGAFVSVAGNGYVGERGIAAQLGVSDPRLWRYPDLQRLIGVLSAGTGRRAMPWGGRAGLEVSTGLDRGSTDIDEYASRDYTTVVSRERGETDTWTVRAVGSQSLGDAGTLDLAFVRGDIRHTETVDGSGLKYRQILTSGSAQALFVVPGAGPVRRFDTSIGGTYDHASTPLTGDKPSFADLDQWGGRVGLSAHVADATALHASASRRARFPSLRELYSGALGSFEPNPDLRPERLTALEAGFTSRWTHSAVQLLGFHHRLADAVVRVRPPGMNYMRVNEEGIRSVGVEVAASHNLRGVEVSGDFTLQDVEVLGMTTGRARPENMPQVFGGVEVRAPVPGQLVLIMDARYTGSQFVIDPETGRDTELAAAGQFHLALVRSWAIGQRSGFSSVTLRASAQNVTDTAQYDAFGLPMPGRTFRFEMRLN